MWTILYNGTEKSLADWGLTDLTRSRQNLGVDTVQFFADGRAVDADEIFPYGSTIIIFRDRVASSSQSNPSYSGGTRWFYGRIEPWSRAGNGRGENQSGACVGPMWYLHNRVFRQTVKSFIGYETPNDPDSALFETKTFSHVFLNQTIDGGKLTWREQVIEAVQWAITCGDPIQIGTISPAFDVPIDEVKNITVAQVLQQMYRWCLDATFWFDYTTTPYPTLHCARQSGLTPVAINLNAGFPLEEIRLKERPDWKRPYVLLQFEQEINGVLQVIDDHWPNPIPAGPPAGGLETTVDLKGWSFQKLTQRVESSPYDVTDLNWWKAKQPWLANTKSIGTVTLITTDPDAPILLVRDTLSAPNGNFQRELLPGGGAIADWMSAYGTQRVRATAYVDVAYKNGSKKLKREITHDFVITNAPTGTYSTTQVTQIGDPVPVGLAHEIYTALQALAVEGSITLTDEELPEVLDFGNSVNFITPLRPAWASLNSLIQQIDESAKDGRCTISFGAPAHLTAGELVDLLRVARNRFNPSPSNLRTGSTGSASSASLPDKGGDGNSTSGAGEYQKHVVSGEVALDGKFYGVKADASTARPVLQLGQFDNQGALITTPSTQSVKMDVSVLPVGKHLALQPCQLTVAGATQTVYVAATEAFTAEGGGGTASPIEQLTLVKVWYNALECRTAEGVIVWVLKSPKLLNSIASEVLDGENHTYTYGADYVTRVSSGVYQGIVRSEAQVIVPRYITNDLIAAEPADVGLTLKIPGLDPVYVNCTFRDTNRDARAWASSNMQFQ